MTQLLKSSRTPSQNQPFLKFPGKSHRRKALRVLDLRLVLARAGPLYLYRVADDNAHQILSDLDPAVVRL